MAEDRLRAIVRQAVAAELQRGNVVARLTEADVQRIAQEVLDRLEERLFPALAEPAPEQTPRRRRPKGRGDYFPPGVSG